jgi:(1->4)-alpha-D-glucan 1-alpha-D-glucosylmutase
MSQATNVRPTATCRLQFHRDFTFEHARDLIPYFAKLGISHIYASPFFRAAPGSTHGYDVCDHNELNPEIGTRAEFEAFCCELKAHGLGLIVDFVPNHMGIEHALNPWWRDVLENGPSSAFARFFDIDWKPIKRELENKVLLPVLAEQYGRTLESGGFRIAFAEGGFHLALAASTLPLSPRSTVSLLQQAVERLSPVPPELQSIVTAIQHLPSRTEVDPERVSEGARERGIIRERIVRLCTEVPSVSEAIEAVVTKWNDPSTPDHFDRLDQLINDQSYRLSSWRVAGEEINYRRFFDVNALAALRMELPEVFDASHRLLLELLNAGFVSGVRIDHIDGLAFPAGYLERLREKGGNEFYLVVEKILATDEKLPREWPVQGTTGYEFANQLAQLLVDGHGIRALAAAYERFAPSIPAFHEIAYRSKKLVMQTMMASEVNVLGNLLNRISESHRWYQDFTLNALTTAVREVIACFPVYRTYLDPALPAEDSDRRIIHRALAMARRRNQAFEWTVFEFLRDVLLPPKQNPHPVDESLRRTFVLKFQQCTGPITAKGLEDTAFYAFNRLVALNEVGGDPASEGIGIPAFHAHNAARLSSHPHNLLATSTHDTKRSEDVRARLATISELADEWARSTRRWHAINRKHLREIDGEHAPDANEEQLLYQTLVGAWPLEEMHRHNREEFVHRIQAYMLKAIREAKVNSSWQEQNEAWENAVHEFVAALLTPSRRNLFPKRIATFAERVARHGAVNSLAQTVLKLTCPGVPDIYQGTELWDFSLVDPDNRRPVDFAMRQQRLDAIENAKPAELLEHWRDGRIKLWVIHRLLSLRRQHQALFAKGSYAGISVQGMFAEKLVAFERRSGNSAMLVVVPRHTAALGFPPLGAVWKDTQLPSAPATSTVWRDVFTGRQHEGAPLQAGDLLATLPFTVLLSEE